jgi:aminoglycoside phosphotransferase (APT) family kinase protein
MCSTLLDRPADLEARLESWLSGLWGRTVSVGSLERFHGGAARETYSFLVLSEEGAQRLVLRRDPPSSLIMTSRAVEFHALARAHGAGLPVPRPLHLAENPEILGAPGFVMEAIEGGRAAGLFEPDPYGPVRKHLGGDLFSTLGRLHALTPDASDQAVLPAWDAAGRLAWWRDALETVATRPEPVALAALRWLERHVPPPSGPPALVHGDFRSGNFLVGRDNRLLAILDWEMAHIGDPMEDLAWAADPLWGHGDPSRIAGTLPLDRATAAWQDASGRRFAAEHWAWWRLFAGLQGLAIWISSAHEVIAHRTVDPVLLFAGLYPYRFHNAEVARMLKALAG